MRMGIIGLPQSGKTTIFNALTRGNEPTGVGVGRMEVHTAVVDVPDERLEQLEAMFRPQKKIYAKVTYTDIAGLGAASEKGEITGQLLNQLSQMDGFIHVVRAFEDPSVAHVRQRVDPQGDLELMDEELIINDQIKVENRLEKLADEHRKGGGRDKGTIEREIVLFEKLAQALIDGQPLRDLNLSKDEDAILTGFGFLSRKPMLVLINLGEDQKPPIIEFKHKQSSLVSLQGKLEMDIAQLPESDAKEFMNEFGLSEMGLEKMIRASYDLLGLQSFFTVGEDEVRAWTITRGILASEAAGEIHTDMEKGFIRAEVISYDDLMEAGSMAEARGKGTLRLEGKAYEVQDGDILSIRFSK